MGKIVPNIKVTNWSVVSPFTKHNVDNEVLCYGKNSPTLLKNYELECSVPFQKTLCSS